MIYQLPNGRTIEISLEQYLELTDVELQELVGLGNQYTMEINDPFYKSFSGNFKEEGLTLTDDTEPDLDQINSIEKLSDSTFHRDDL